MGRRSPRPHPRPQPGPQSSGASTSPPAPAAAHQGTDVLPDSLTLGPVSAVRAGLGRLPAPSPPACPSSLSPAACGPSGPVWVLTMHLHPHRASHEQQQVGVGSAVSIQVSLMDH